MNSDPAKGTLTSCSLTPWLSVRKSSEAVEFYKSAFSAIEVYRFDGPDASVVARLSIGGAEFWVGDESAEHGNFSPESLEGSSVRMILTVPDPDAVFLHALTAGASQVYPVSERHGWRVGRVVQPIRASLGSRPTPLGLVIERIAVQDTPPDDE